MADVRDLVERAVRDVRAEPDALDRTVRRLRARRRNRRVGAGTLALVLAAGATWLVWRSFAAAPRTIPAAPQGGRIVFTTQGPGDGAPFVAVADADGSDMRVLAAGDEPAWSADGARIAFTRTSPDGSTGIYVMNADGSEERRLTTNARGLDENPSWSPDGHRIVFSRSRFVQTDPDPVASRSHRDLYTVALDGTAPTKLLGGSTDDYSPAWSPDGSLVAFVRVVEPAGEGPVGAPQIWTVRADGAGASQLTAFDRGAWRPAWSPDGSALAFDDAGSDIYIVGSDGGGLHRLELPSGWGEEAESPFDPAWSPAGTRIAFAAGGEQGHDIFVVDVGGTDLERLTGPETEDNEPAWVASPE